MLDEIRAAAAKAEDGSDVYIANRPFPAMGPVFFRSPHFPGSAGVFVIFFPDNTVDGHRVYFVEPEHKYYAHVRNGRRTAKLLVPRPPTTQTATAPTG